VIFDVGSDHAVLNNDGDIFGRAEGVFMGSSHDGGIIHNSGSIRSAGNGLTVDTGVSDPTMITNAAGGLIKGTTGIFTAIAGRIALNNHGTVSGGIDCNAPNENDVVVNHGTILGAVRLGSGNGTFFGATGRSGNVFGEDGNDHLFGSTGTDVLNGGAGNDIITGGHGRDFLAGGAGRDLFDFNSLADSAPGAHRDAIFDFTHGTNVTGDDIDLRTIDAKAGVAGNQAFHFIGASPSIT
jgi:Ca2+-binding RTX toxin-like protein